MLHQRDLIIEGQTYTVIQFPATKSLTVLFRLIKLVGGPATVVAMEGLKDIMKADTSEKFFSQAISALLDNLDAEDSVDLLKTLVGAAHVENKSVLNDFDTRFQGSLETVFELAAESVKVQYGSFSNALARLSSLAKKMNKGKTDSPALSISPGSSGA